MQAARSYLNLRALRHHGKSAFTVRIAIARVVVVSYAEQHKTGLAKPRSAVARVGRGGERGLWLCEQTTFATER